MADEKQGSESTDKPDAVPAAEELAPQADGKTPNEAGGDAPLVVTQAAKRRHASYKPSHKATFIGAGVVAVILIANGIGLTFILKSNDAAKKVDTQSVTLSSTSLDKLGVSRNAAGTDGVTLKINPATSFGSGVTVANDLAVGGQLKLNGKFTAPEAAFAKLQGGDTALDKLNVNGDATISNLELRKDLSVLGATKLQGQVTISQLTTINNNLNVAGTVSIGGALSVKTLQVANFQTSGNLTFGGHIITSGSAPGVASGGAVGNFGTVSINGNDSAGTVAVNVGVGATGGVLATVSFRGSFASTPHVVAGVVGNSVPGMYINRNSNGFTIVTPNGLPSGGYAFDYIVVQ